MKKTSKILLAVGAAAAIGLTVYAIRRHRTNRRHYQSVHAQKLEKRALLAWLQKPKDATRTSCRITGLQEYRDRTMEWRPRTPPSS